MATLLISCRHHPIFFLALPTTRESDRVIDTNSHPTFVEPGNYGVDALFEDRSDETESLGETSGTAASIKESPAVGMKSNSIETPSLCLLKSLSGPSPATASSIKNHQEMTSSYVNSMVYRIWQKDCHTFIVRLFFLFAGRGSSLGSHWWVLGQSLSSNARIDQSTVRLPTNPL